MRIPAAVLAFMALAAAGCAGESSVEPEDDDPDVRTVDPRAPSDEDAVESDEEGHYDPFDDPLCRFCGLG